MENYRLTPSLLRVNDQLIEAYSRDSNASDERKEELGLDLENPIKANIGLASIEEYLILKLRQPLLPKERAFWNLSSLGTAIKIESIWIDSPQADRFNFEIVDAESQVIFNLVFGRNQTPYAPPVALVAGDNTIRITAKDKIDFIRIICKPIIILKSINPSLSSQTISSPEPPPIISFDG